MTLVVDGLNENKEVLERLSEVKFDLKILDSFKFDVSYFDKLDSLLIHLGYHGRDDLIREVHDYIKRKITNVGMGEYNKFLTAFNVKIFNHIELLESHQDKIDWERLSSNPSAIALLEANQDKIDWDELSRNPAAMK